MAQNLHVISQLTVVQLLVYAMTNIVVCVASQDLDLIGGVFKRI